MSAEANKALVRRLFEEVFNKRNLAVADELLSPESLNHDDPHEVGRVGSGALKGAVQMLAAAFPDFHMTIEDLVAEGDKVVARVTASGTHQGRVYGDSAHRQALHRGADAPGPGRRWQSDRTLGCAR